MRKNTLDWITALVFCGFLAAMALGYLLLPKADFSQNEKRYLQELPTFSWSELLSGEWGEQAEDYLADHMPGRDFFVGLNAYADLLSGRMDASDVRLKQGRLLEAPAELSEEALEKSLNAIAGFAQALDTPVELILVPSAGWACGYSEYEDARLIQEIYSRSAEYTVQLDLCPVFAGQADYFYKTDHHWNSAGAYAACRAYMDWLGRDYPEAENFQIEEIPGFHGSTYSRSALWLTPAESIELWSLSEGLTVENEGSEQPHNGVFYREHLEEADKYTVFLDGNHSLVRVTNSEGTGKVLVIRDSYSNCLGCFLAQSFQETVLVDLRYYRSAVSALAEEGFDHVLICYSLGNFLTDTNLVWLR